MNHKVSQPRFVPGVPPHNDSPTSLLVELDLPASVTSRAAPLQPDPPRDQGLLASQLQKAIRRGITEHAVAAAVALSDFVPKYLARRFPVIAYEDIGVASPSLLVEVKHLSAALPVLPADARRSCAALMAAKLAQSPKSRTACDIACLLDASADTARYARLLLDMPPGKWIADAANGGLPILHRATAVRFALGLTVAGLRPSHRRGSRNDILPAIASAMHLPAAVVAATDVGGSTHNLHAGLPLAFDLIRNATSDGDVTAASDLLVRRTQYAGVLLCAVDMYTRAGRRAYAKLVRSSWELRDLLGASADPAAAIGMLLFHVEGSILDRALTSAASIEVQDDIETLEGRRVGISPDIAEEVHDWLIAQIEVVDDFRRREVAHYLGRVQADQATE